MKYKQMILDVGKYSIYYVKGNKATLLLSENEKKDLKRVYLEKIANKYKGKEVVFVRLVKIAKQDLENSKKSPIKGIGGPISAEVMVYQINDQGKMVISDDEKRHYKIWFTENYLKKKKEITEKDLKKIAIKTYEGKIVRKLLSVLTYENLK
jgi:hypothetical protein